jgi:hypothetical protein
MAVNRAEDDGHDDPAPLLISREARPASVSGRLRGIGKRFHRERRARRAGCTTGECDVEGKEILHDVSTVDGTKCARLPGEFSIPRKRKPLLLGGPSIAIGG